MKEASFIKIEQLLPFLFSSFVTLFIAAQIATIVFCKYLYKKDLSVVLEDLKIFFLMQFLTFIVCILCGIALWQQNIEVFYDPMKQAIIMTKLAICALISVNLCYMYIKFLNAKKIFKQEYSIEIEESIIIITNYFIPLNIFLSFLNIYLSVTIRDF